MTNAFSHNLCSDNVASHRISRCIGRNEQVAVRSRIERPDKTKAFGIRPESARHKPRHRRECNDVTGADYQSPRATEFLKRLLELRIFLGTHFQRLGQLTKSKRLVVRVFKQFGYSSLKNLRHFFFPAEKRKAPNRLSHRQGAVLVGSGATDSATGPTPAQHKAETVFNKSSAAAYFVRPSLT